MEARKWGRFWVLENEPHHKIKKLWIMPKSATSMQKHFHRSEFFLVLRGVLRIALEKDTVDISEHYTYEIQKEQLHQLRNETDKPILILEIQFGDKCEEKDIERV